jgi:hypothetical protein
MDKAAEGLNFREAIAAHQKWKVRLQAVIDGNHAEQLFVDVVSRDDQCVLGKWIHGVGGQRFGDDQAFQRLCKHHADFHVCAGAVLVMAQEGNKTDSQANLTSGDYARVSMDLILDLAQMYNQASGKQA